MSTSTASAFRLQQRTLGRRRPHGVGQRRQRPAGRIGGSEVGSNNSNKPLQRRGKASPVHRHVTVAAAHLAITCRLTGAPGQARALGDNMPIRKVLVRVTRGGDRRGRSHRGRRRRTPISKTASMPSTGCRPLCAQAANLRSDRSPPSLRVPIHPAGDTGNTTRTEIRHLPWAQVARPLGETLMHSVGCPASWLIRPDAKLPVGELESRIIIDSMHLGRYLGISDLMVAAPSEQRRHRRHYRVRISPAAAAGVQRHAHISQLRSPGQRLGGPVRCLGRPRDLGYTPYRRPDPTPRTAGSG